MSPQRRRGGLGKLTYVISTVGRRTVVNVLFLQHTPHALSYLVLSERLHLRERSGEPEMRRLIDDEDDGGAALVDAPKKSSFIPSLGNFSVQCVLRVKCGRRCSAVARFTRPPPACSQV